MNKQWKVTYALIRGLSSMLWIGLGSVAVNLGVAVWIVFRNRKYGLPVEELFRVDLEGTAAIFMLLMALIHFTIHFKLMLAHGATRKQFFWGYVSALVICSAAFAVFIWLIRALAGLWMPIQGLSAMAYGQRGAASDVLLQFAVYLVFAALGWVIHLAYYRGNTLSRWIISLAPFALAVGLKALDTALRGAVERGLDAFFQAVTGFAGPTPNLLIGTASLLALAAGLFAVSCALLRRAPLKV